MQLIVNYLPLFGVIALAFVFWKNAWVSKQEEGNEKMSRIAKNISDGAMSFLKARLNLNSIKEIQKKKNIAQGETIVYNDSNYGITTRFGFLKNCRISKKEIVDKT